MQGASNVLIMCHSLKTWRIWNLYIPHNQGCPFRMHIFSPGHPLEGRSSIYISQLKNRHAFSRILHVGGKTEWLISLPRPFFWVFFFKTTMVINRASLLNVSFLIHVFDYKLYVHQFLIFKDFQWPYSYCKYFQDLDFPTIIFKYF